MGLIEKHAYLSNIYRNRRHGLLWHLKRLGGDKQ